MKINSSSIALYEVETSEIKIETDEECLVWIGFNGKPCAMRRVSVGKADLFCHLVDEEAQAIFEKYGTSEGRRAKSEA